MSETIRFGDTELKRPISLSLEQTLPLSMREFFQGVLDHSSDQDLQNFWISLTHFVQGTLHPTKLNQAEAVLGETHQGVIARLTDSVVVIRYGTGDQQFELEYQRPQFYNDATLKKGDSIEAAIALWREGYQARGTDYYLSKEEQEKLDAAWKTKKGVVGDLEL